MALAVVAVGTGNTGSTAATSVVATFAASPASGDLLLAFVVFYAYVPGSTVTPPASQSWNLLGTQIQGNIALQVYWRVAGPGEPTATTWSQGASNSIGVVLLDIGGAATTAPQFAIVGSATAATSTPSLTPATAGSLPVGGFCIDANAATPTLGGGQMQQALIQPQYFPLEASTSALTSAPVSQSVTWSATSNNVAALVIVAPGASVAVAAGAVGNAASSGAIGDGRNPGGAVGNG